MPITGCLFVVLPTIIVLIVLATIIPNEPVPRVVDLGGGAAKYCFQSLDEAILMPTCVIVLPAFFILSLFVFKTRNVTNNEAPRPTGLLKHLGWIRFGFHCIVGVALVAILAAVLAVVISTSWRDFRCVVVERDSVEMHSLLRSWSLPRSRIVRTRYVHENDPAGHAPKVKMSFLIEDDAGNRHPSVQIQLNLGDPRLVDFEKVFEKLESQLTEPAK